MPVVVPAGAGVGTAERHEMRKRGVCNSARRLSFVCRCKVAVSTPKKNISQWIFRRVMSDAFTLRVYLPVIEGDPSARCAIFDLENSPVPAPPTCLDCMPLELSGRRVAFNIHRQSHSVLLHPTL